MAAYKGTAFWNLTNATLPCGFSESFEFERGSDPDAIDVWINGTYQKNRSLVTAESWQLVSLRLSRLVPTAIAGPPETCLLREDQVMVCGTNLFGGALGPSDLPWAALLYDIFPLNPPPAGWIGGSRARKYQLRGIPDIWWNQAAVNFPPGAKGQVDTFLKWVVNTLQAGNIRANPACDGILNNRYSTWCFRRPSNRQIGRPFGLLRGRR